MVSPIRNTKHKSQVRLQKSVQKQSKQARQKQIVQESSNLSEQERKKDDGTEYRKPQTRKSRQGGCFLKNSSQRFFEVTIELAGGSITYVESREAESEADSNTPDDIRDAHVKLGKRETCPLTSQVFYSITLDYPSCELSKSLYFKSKSVRGDWYTKLLDL